MKLQLMLVFAILSMLLIPSVVYGEEFYATTDKSEYYSGETIFISGHTINYDASKALSYIVISSEDNIITIAQEVVNTDNTFDFEIESFGLLWNVYEFYTVKINYGAESGETTFELLPNGIQFESDKDIYYEHSTIFINGTMTETDWDADTTVYCNVYDEDDNLIESWSDDYLQEDGTFEFNITTSGKQEWKITTEMRMDITIQNSTNTISFLYIDDVDKSPEANYEKIKLILDILSVLTENEDNQDIMRDIRNQINELKLDR